METYRRAPLRSPNKEEEEGGGGGAEEEEEDNKKERKTQEELEGNKEGKGGRQTESR